MINSHVYRLIRMTHLLIKNFFVLNSISIAFSISTAYIMTGKAAFGIVASFS